jgi:transposase
VRARRLTDQEGQRLQQIVRRGKHGSVRVRRAMIIMASASGTLVPAIARLVAADEDTVRDVIHLFNHKGLAALDPQWAGGRPRLISDQAVEVIVTAATTRPEKPGQPFTRRSLRKLPSSSADRPRPVAIGRERLRQLRPSAGGRSAPASSCASRPRTRRGPTRSRRTSLPSPRKRRTSAAPAASASCAAAGSSTSRSSLTTPSGRLQVATARPCTRVIGRNSPLTVMMPVCRPRIGSRETQPRRWRCGPPG